MYTAFHPSSSFKAATIHSTITSPVSSTRTFIPSSASSGLVYSRSSRRPCWNIPSTSSCNVLDLGFLAGSFLPPSSSSELSRYSQRLSSFFRNFCFLHWFRIRCRLTPSEVLLSLDDSDAFFCCGFSRKFLDLRCSHLLLLALCPETSRTTNMVLKISLYKRKNEFYTWNLMLL